MKIKIKLPKDATIDELRNRRELAASDGDMALAFACASEIDRRKAKPRRKR